MVMISSTGLSETPGKNQEVIGFCKENSWKTHKYSNYFNLLKKDALAYSGSFADCYWLSKRRSLHS